MSDRDTGPVSGPQKTLQLKQTWFLGVMVAAVVAMFAFVILPYVDPQKGAAVSGVAAEDFDVALLGAEERGDRVRLGDLAGKTVILDFWASWCRPCLAQSEVLNQVAARVGDGAVILGIATSDTRADAEAFVADHELAYATAYDAGDQVAQAYGIDSLPTLLVIDPSGTIVGRYSRILPVDELLQIVSEASP